MNLEEIKKEAKRCKCDDIPSLSLKITELKNKGVSFLGCVAFVQVNQKISLKEAQELTVQLEAYTKDEKRKIEEGIDVMLSDFKEEE
ncbi:hypothetical protein [Aquimarina sp. 2201CG14-23]|uniref:hypothetical protein n=1 Tax=Aquimarina mycalae TaxID=3040073 RepID=UPI00247819F2|nr:hypothetical protein [Aquimarina sp. 2201CG14-23]MDH7447610.1 hypothetical protein [Aquimarina sp. 2201CG14-23]